MVGLSSLDGRVAIITGGSAGIGRATAHSLADAGANVVVAARRSEKLRNVVTELEDEHGGIHIGVQTDVTERSDIDELVDTVLDEYGNIDILVNNAGVVRGGRIDEITWEHYRDMMAINVGGVFAMTKAALPAIRETGGNIVFIGSDAGEFPFPKNPTYSGTKWWVRGFAYSLAAAEKDELRVNIVNPAGTRTAIGPETLGPLRERTEPGEIMEPEDVAEVVAFVVRCDETVTETTIRRQSGLPHL